MPAENGRKQARVWLSIAVIAFFALFASLAPAAADKSSSSAPRLLSEKIVYTASDSGGALRFAPPDTVGWIFAVFELPLKRAGIYSVMAYASDKAKNGKPIVPADVPHWGEYVTAFLVAHTIRASGPSIATTDFALPASAIIDSVRTWPYYYRVEVTRYSDLPDHVPDKPVYYTFKSTFTTPPALGR